MPLESEDSTDITGVDQPASARTPQEINANANRKVKRTSTGGGQQGGGQPGPASPLGQLAQQAGQVGQDIGQGAQGLSRSLAQAGFANPTGDPWNLLDFAKETAQDAGATWGLARKVANTLGGQYSDGVANVWQGHTGTDWVLKQMTEAGVWVNPFSALSAAFQLEDPKGEGLGSLFDISDTEYAQRQKAQQQGGRAAVQQQDQSDEQRKNQIMQQAGQSLPSSYFDLATSLIAPEDKLAMLGSQAIPPIVSAFLTGGPSDQQSALEWMAATALLMYVPIPESMKQAMVKKVPALGLIFQKTAEAQRAAQVGSRAASSAGKTAQLTTDAIKEQLNRGALPEHYSDPLAKAKKPGEAEERKLLIDDTGHATMLANEQKKNIQDLYKKLGISDVDELVHLIRANGISDDGVIETIRKNWKGLGLSYDLLRYLPEEQPLRDPRRWLDSLPESVSSKVKGAIDKAQGKQPVPAEFKPTTSADLVDGKPGVYRLYRGSKDGSAVSKGQQVSYLTSDPQYAGSFGDVSQTEYDAANPYVLHQGSNAEQLADAQIAAGELKATAKASRVAQYRRGIAPASLGEGAVKWLKDQGHDLVVAKGIGKQGKSPVALALDPDRVNMQAAAGLEQDVTNALGGKTEGHNFVVALNGYLDQIHRDVFGNGSDPMRSLLRSLAGNSRALNYIDQHYMAATVDLLKGQMTEALGTKIGRAVEGDQKAYDELPPQAKMVADGWGLLRAASREEAKGTDYFDSVVPNWMPRPDKMLGDVLRKRGRPARADSLLAKDAQKHRDEALTLDPKGHIVLGQHFQYVADANKALKATRQQLVADLLSPGKALAKEFDDDPLVPKIRKLLSTDPEAAAQLAETLAWQKYADKETNFLKNVSRVYANQVRAIHTHSALQQFTKMTAKDGRKLVRQAVDDRDRGKIIGQDYKTIDDIRFSNYLFHPDLARDLNRYIDHVKLPDFPENVATDGRKLVVKPDSANQVAALLEKGYHTLDAPLFGTVRGNHPWLFHPDVKTISDLTSAAGKYWWGRIKSPEWYWNTAIAMEGRAIAQIMFSPLVHALNIASRFGMGYMSNPREMTKYLLGKGAKPWNHEADDVALRMEAFNAGYIPHARNKNYADNLLSTMSDAYGDIEDQLPKDFEQGQGRMGQVAALWHDRPRPMQKVNNWFWGSVNDFGVMMYHLEKTAATKAGLAEQNAREYAARRANSWVGAVAPEDTNPLLHQAMRLLTFAPNWWRTWGELLVPIYKRAGFTSDPAYLKFAARQSAKTIAAAVGFQKLTGEALNYLATSSTPWAFDGHWQQQNQAGNQDKIEATGNWLNDIPGIDFFAPTPDVNSSDPAAKAAGERGAVRTIENPFGRQQFATEEAAGFEEGVGAKGGQDLLDSIKPHNYWQPEDTYDGLSKFVAARLSPIFNAVSGAANIDVYQSISDHQLRAIDTNAAPGSISPASLLTGMMMMTPVGLQFAQNVQKASAQGDTNPVASALGTKVPDSLQAAIGDIGDPTARMLWSWFTGTNAPYDTAQKTRGMKPSDQDYQRVAQLQQQYDSQMRTLQGEWTSGQMSPSQWRSAYSTLSQQHAAQMEALFKGSPEYVNGPEGMLNDYMGLYDDPRVMNPDGSTNQEMLTVLQNQFLAQHTPEQIQQMNALKRQNDTKYPALKLYHTMLDNYDKWQQTWATQNNVDLSTLHKDIQGYSAVYGNTGASQQYLRQHPELSRYERAKTQWQRSTSAGMLYAMFYGTSSAQALLRQSGGQGPSAAQVAERLGQQVGTGG